MLVRVHPLLERIARVTSGVSTMCVLGVSPKKSKKHDTMERNEKKGATSSNQNALLTDLAMGVKKTRARWFLFVWWSKLDHRNSDRTIERT